MRGFFMLELAIVFACMICGGFLLVRFADNMRAYALVRQEVERLFATCAMLRAQAHMDAAMHRILCDESRSGYFVDGVWHAFAGSVRYGARGSGLSIMGPPSAPTHVLESFVSFPQKQIMFYPDGSINSGVVYMGSARVNALYAISSSVSDTFFLRLYTYASGSWRLIDGRDQAGAA